MAEAPERNLAMDIVRITEAAALASARWLGRGKKEEGDGAAVQAMRNSWWRLTTVERRYSMVGYSFAPRCRRTVISRLNTAL